jgi:hypothetical protein
MVGDLAYVGNANRNNPTLTPINSFGFGTTRVDLNPQNADPTQNNNQAMPGDYLRDFRGFGPINLRQWNGYANYHSIQASVNRRMSSGFAWGVSYTGSRRFARGNRNPFLDAARDEARNYSKNGSRPHVMNINYNYIVPDASQLWDNLLVRGVLDGWQVSGNTQILSGQWDDFTNNYSGAPFNDLTGGPGGGRPALACDPMLPRSERTLERQFRTECIQMPGPTSDPNDIFYLGTDSNAHWVTPGYVNHDLTLFKNFRMNSNRNLQVRVEFYNLLNSNQFTQVDTGATFNFATGEQTDAGFGTVTNTRANSTRVIQLGLRFTF